MQKIFKLASKFVKTSKTVKLLNEEKLYNALKSFFNPKPVPKYEQYIETDYEHELKYVVVVVYAGKDNPEDGRLREYINDYFQSDLDEYIMVYFEDFTFA